MHNLKLLELIEKRQNLTANVFEEQELIDLAEKLPPEEKALIPQELLKLSSENRMQSIIDKLNKMLEHL